MAAAWLRRVAVRYLARARFVAWQTRARKPRAYATAAALAAAGAGD